MKDIAERIKEARLAKGMTQDELAKALGLNSLTSINKMEKNTYEIGLDRIKEIARILEVDPDYLVFGDSDDKQEEATRLFSQLSEDSQEIVLQLLRSLNEARG